MSRKVALFVDGDFWHRYRFPRWKAKLSAYWQAKIERNRGRGRRNSRRLRRGGWIVVRISQHQLESTREACQQRVLSALSSAEARY